MAGCGIKGVRKQAFLKAWSMISWRSVLGIRGNSSRMAASACAFIPCCVSGIGSGASFTGLIRPWRYPRAACASSTMASRIWCPTRDVCKESSFVLSREV